MYQGGVVPSSSDWNKNENFAIMDDVLGRHAAAGDCDVVVFPELFIGGYNNAPSFNAEPFPGDTEEILSRLVLRHGLYCCVGYCEKVPHISDKFYNSVLLLDRSGKILLRHRKTHLWADFERNFFLPGDDVAGVVSVCGGVQVSVAICYEIEFPEISREASRRGCQVLLVPTAVCVASGEEMRVLSDCLVMARAVENNMYVVYCNRAGRERPRKKTEEEEEKKHNVGSHGEGERDTKKSKQDDAMVFNGGSVIVSPLGKILVRLGETNGESGCATCSLDVIAEAQKRHPFLKDLRHELF